MKKQWIKKVIGGILCGVLLLSVCTEVAPIQTLAATKENLYLYMSPNTGKYGFVNDGGLVMIDPVYDQAYDFNNGMALVSKDDKYGYISENGNIVVQPKYEYASSFSCGYAVVKNQEKYKFINTKGKNAFSAVYEDANPFSENLAAVKIGKKYGLSLIHI